MTTNDFASIIPDLQRRIARLLLSHDRRTFRSRFREFYAGSALPQTALLQAYDRLTRLLALADELFDDILPRIRRQMSFHATRLRLDEEDPIRGQIDWQRSLERAWRDQPDQPPVRFITTLRSRSFATPENQFVVAVLLRYAVLLNRLRLDEELLDAPLKQAENREIDQLVDQVRRELATPHFQELARESDLDDLRSLADQVALQLRAGHNPYADLLGWWERIEQLQIRTPATHTPAPTFDTQNEAGLLFQLWIALELVDLLAEQGKLRTTEIRTDHLQFQFVWHERLFQLVYDRQPKAHLAWQHAPGERPDYFITRATRLVIKHQAQTIWQEPGVLLDAKCLSGNAPSRATDAIKRMLADIQLLDATHGMLLLNDLTGLSATKIVPDPSRYLAHVPVNAAVQLFGLRPLSDQRVLHATLGTVLDSATAALPERVAVQCHGRWPDVDTVNPGELPDPSSKQIFCPKPHIAPDRVDLVDVDNDCLKEPRVCHILSQDLAPGWMPPFVRRVLSQADLVTAIGKLRDYLNSRYDETDPSEEADQARTAVLTQMEALVTQYSKIMQPNTRQIEELLSWAFSPLWNNPRQPRSLASGAREMLISGEFVWNAFQQSAVSDWAACGVQYVRAIEVELARRLYHRCGGKHVLQDARGAVLSEKGFTFGTVCHAYNTRNNPKESHHNWQEFVSRAALASGATVPQFEAVIDKIVSLKDLRNRIAHTASISQEDAKKVRDATIGDPGTGRTGVLPALIALLDA